MTPAVLSRSPLSRFASLASLFLLSASLLHCDKENNIDQSSSSNTTVGNVCGPKVACADGTCAFGFCRSSCSDDSDCANSGVCLSDGTTKACRLPLESKCGASAPCPAGLTCGGDGSCRTPCDETRPCEVQGQSCQQGTCITLNETGGAGGQSGGAGTSGQSGEGGENPGGKGGEGGSAAGQGGAAGTGGSAGEGGMSGASGEGGMSGGGGSGGAACTPELGGECCEGSCGTTLGMVCENAKCECDLGAIDCDGKAENGCEAQLLADPKNCGACGHDCSGGECKAGKCQPVLLVTTGVKDGEAQPTTGGYPGLFDFLPVDKDGIVLPVNVPATGKIQLRAFDMDGKPGAFLTNEPNGLVVNAGPFLTPGGVFWQEGGTIKRVARAGGATSTVVPWDPYALHIEGGSIYVADSAANPKLERIPSGSLTLETVYPAISGGGHIFAPQGSAIFWQNGGLNQGDVSGGVSTLKYAAFVPQECNFTTTLNVGMTANADAVFGWASWCPNQGKAQIFRYDRSTGQYSTLLDPQNNKTISWLVADGPSLFYIDKLSIYHLPSTGGTSSELTTSPGGFYGLAQVDGYLFTLKLSSGPGDFGGLVRIAKP